MRSADTESRVRQAWCATLDVPCCVGTWEEAGGDSLATLHLVYRLEDLLGRTLQLEMFQPDMTVETMAIMINVPPTAVGDGPCVFLMPGVLGDGPDLAAFRRRLAGQVHFELVPALRVQDPASVLTDVRAAGWSVAQHLLMRQPEGPIFLAGYSFGGSVALEAAVELIAAGRTVAQLAIFDSAFGDAVLGPPVLSARRRWRRLAARVWVPLMKWDGARRVIIRAIDSLLPNRRLNLRRFILGRFRVDARQRWSPRSLTVPMFLAVSDEFAAVMGPVWQRLYPQVAIARIPGKHIDLFRGEALEIVSVAFVKVFENAIEAPYRR